MKILDRFRRGGVTLEELRLRTLLVPVPDDRVEQPGLAVLDEPRDVAFIVVEDVYGNLVLPAFTSEEALTRWKPEGSAFVAVPGDVLVELLAGSDWDRMVIDGANPKAFVITRSEAGSLVGIAALHPVEEGSQILIGLPAQGPPEGFVESLRRACEQEPTIVEAYLYQRQILPRDEMPHLAVAVRLDPGVEEEATTEVLEAVGRKLEPRRWGYEYIDFHPLDDGMLETVRSTGIPIARTHY